MSSLLLSLLTSLGLLALRPAAPLDELRVMSFNIRYGSADDGQNAWPKRRALVLDLLREFEPHVLGLQEALRFQLDEIEQALPRWREVGVGRDDGARAGEYSAILFDSGRLALLEQGTFWLSDEPERVASTSWGNEIPRICTWARFEDRSSGRRFHAFNTHWDHRSQASRERSAKLILQRVRAAAADGPALLLGDFNAGEQNAAFRALLDEASPRLADSFRRLHPQDSEVGTFNGFAGRRDGAKIDAILVSPHWQVLAAQIQRQSRAGRYPSDHFPVLARLSLQEAASELELEVVERETGKPLSEAQVWWLPDSSAPLETLVSNLDPWARHLELGRLFTTDEAGRVRLPASRDPRSPATVVVQAGALWSSRSLPMDASTPLRIRLRPERRLLVHVEQADGRPAARVPLLLRREGSPRLERQLSSDASGRADFRHLSALALGDPDDPLVDPGDEGWNLAFDFPAPSDLQQRLHLVPGQTQVSVLQLPQLGSVTVHFEGADGGPYLETAAASLSLDDDPSASAQGLLATRGSAHFARVALGSALLLETQSVEHGQRLRTLPALARADEHVEVRIEWTPVVPILVGRALAPDGRPLAGERLTLRVATVSAELQLDGEGRFRQPLNSGDLERARGATSGQLQSSHTRFGEAPLFGSFELHLTSRKGEFDLGELRLERMRLALSGRILRPEGLAPADPALAAGLLTLTRPGNPRERYSSEVAADGRFEVFAPDGGGEWEVEYLNHEQLRLKQQRVLGGREPVELATFARATLSGSLVWNAGIEPRQLVLRFLSAEKKREAKLDENGRFEVSGLEPGSWDLVIETYGYQSRTPVLRFRGRGALARIEGLEVDDRGRCADERLARIDLRGELFAVPLVLVDEQQRELPRATVTVGDGVGAPAQFDWSGGTIYSDLPALDLHLAAAGHQSVLLRGVEGPQHVEMRAGLPLRVELAPPALSLEDGTRLRVELTQTGPAPPFGDVRQLERVTREFGPHEPLELLVPSEGRYEVQLYLRKGNHAGRLMRAEAPILALGAAGPRELRLQIEPAWVEAARREIGE